MGKGPESLAKTALRGGEPFEIQWLKAARLLHISPGFAQLTQGRQVSTAPVMSVMVAVPVTVARDEDREAAADGDGGNGDDDGGH
jgi:hypothetical protein